jgi:hypothetical protein
MNKYVYSICLQDEWPCLETVSASGIEEAEDKIIFKYCDKFEIDNNLDYLQFQEELNNLGIVISDLYDIEEL